MKKTYISITFAMMIFICLLGCGASKDTTSESVAEVQPEEVMQSLEELEETMDTREDELSLESVEEETYSDEDFLRNASDVLIANWTADVPDDGSQETLKKIVQAEKSVLIDFKDAKFEDRKLQEYALKFYNAIEEEEKACEMPEDSQEDFAAVTEAWNKADLSYTQVVCELYDNYDLPIDARYISRINQMHNKLNVTEYGIDAFNQVMIMASMQNYAVVPNPDTGKYTFIYGIKNDTKYDFKDMKLAMIIIGKSGDVKEVIYAELPDWPSMSEGGFTFESETIDDTTKDDIVGWQVIYVN